MNFKRVLLLMRKLVLFLFFSALFLLYPCVSDSPIVERITKGEVLESIKTFFAFEQSASQEDIPSNRPSDDTQDKNRGLVNNHPAKSASERREALLKKSLRAMPKM